MIQVDDVFDVSAVFARYRPELEAVLQAAVRLDRSAPDLYAVLRYHMGWLDENLNPVAARTGKMLRPMLCLLACEAAGGDYHDALPAAASVELLHNFSLIHDDVEDRSAARRGRQTVWAKWGEPLAVNAGDALLIISELALVRSIDDGLSAATTLAMLRLLNDCCLTLTEGQHLDITNESNVRLDEDNYFKIIAGKTAALVGCSLQLGAVAAGATDDRARAYRRFGELVGLGFQVQDDVLGVWGDPIQTGKPAAADVFGRKMTLPVIDALARAPAASAKRLSDIYGAIAPSPADVAEAIGILDAVGARERADERAREYLDRALEALDEAEPLAGPGSGLRSIARSLVGREA